MIKFDFTFVLCLMVILVSTLLVIFFSLNSKWSIGLFKCCPRAPNQYVTPLGGLTDYRIRIRELGLGLVVR